MGLLIDNVDSASGLTARTLQLDYHSLRRRDALRKFDELVVPILPVIGNIHIITGKGKHSPGGVAVIREALKDHIDHHEQNSEQKRFGWEPFQNNPGIIRVFHIP